MDVGFISALILDNLKESSHLKSALENLESIAVVFTENSKAGKIVIGHDINQVYIPRLGFFTFDQIYRNFVYLFENCQNQNTIEYLTGDETQFQEIYIAFYFNIVRVERKFVLPILVLQKHNQMHKDFFNNSYVQPCSSSYCIQVAYIRTLLHKLLLQVSKLTKDQLAIISTDAGFEICFLKTHKSQYLAVIFAFTITNNITTSIIPNQYQGFPLNMVAPCTSPVLPPLLYRSLGLEQNDVVCLEKIPLFDLFNQVFFLNKNPSNLTVQRPTNQNQVQAVEQQREKLSVLQCAIKYEQPLQETMANKNVQIGSSNSVKENGQTFNMFEFANGIFEPNKQRSVLDRFPDDLEIPLEQLLGYPQNNQHFEKQDQNLNSKIETTNDTSCSQETFDPLHIKSLSQKQVLNNNYNYIDTSRPQFSSLHFEEQNLETKKHGNFTPPIIQEQRKFHYTNDFQKKILQEFQQYQQTSNNYVFDEGVVDTMQNVCAFEQQIKQLETNDSPFIYLVFYLYYLSSYNYRYYASWGIFLYMLLKTKRLNDWEQEQMSQFPGQAYHPSPMY